MFIFNVSLSFSLNLFWPPPFSVSLSLSLCFLLSFLLPSCLSFCFLFVSCFCLFFIFLSSLLLFHEKNNMNIFNCNFFFSWNSFSFFWFPVLLFLSNPFFLSLLFPDFKLCFSTSMFLVKKNKVEKHQFLVKRGVATKRAFLWACVLENVKSYRFFCPFFCQILVDVQKQKHYKNTYFSTFLKAKNWKKNAFWGVIIWAK